MAQLAYATPQPVTFLVIGLLIAVIVIILLLISRNQGKDSGNLAKSAQEPKRPTLTTCPLCQTKLMRGELLHSARFPGKNFDLIHIFGCPYCYPDHKRAVEKAKRKKRRCPVCLDTLPRNAHVYAEGTTQRGKNHMHVVGCTLCR